LRVGDTAVIEITGLRNPCKQLDHYQPGLMQAVLGRDAEGELIRKAGVMGVVVTGGPVRAGDGIRVELPAPPHERLAPV
jgi:MOSC domain-containing protein YiiM